MGQVLSYRCRRELRSDWAKQQPDKTNLLCEAPNHVYKQQFTCANDRCNNIVCSNCRYIYNNKLICKVCKLSYDNIDEQMASLQVAELTQTQEDFDIQNSRPKGFQKVVSINLNSQTGQIIGWDTLWKAIAQEDEQAKDLLKECQDFFDNKDSNGGTGEQELLIDSDDLKHIYTMVDSDDPSLENNRDQMFILRNNTLNRDYKVSVISDPGSKKVIFKNLPEELQPRLNLFSEQEKLQTPKDVIYSIIKSQRDLQTPKKIDLLKEVLPTEEQLKNKLEQVSILRQEDPTPYYNIRRKIAKGGQSSVFEVERKSDSLRCALKMALIKNQQIKEGIVNEINLLQLCQDARYVLKQYEAYEFRERLWIFVELMDLGALTPILEERYESLNENMVKYILLKTLQGLDYLHSKGIMHRDIKSDNILVNSKGELKLADFGYAAHLTQERQNRTSRVGTVCWMAPELIKQKESYSNKIDIWSFGILCMELANGNPPYLNEPQFRVLYKILSCDPPQIDRKWSSQFQDFVSQCLQKDPKRRPSAADLLNHEFLIDAEECKDDFVHLLQVWLQDSEDLINRK